MSYGPPPGGNQGYYGGPPPSHSPQPGYGPPGQYNQGPPPQGHSPYPPQQGGYGPPGGQPPYQQGGYNQGPPPQHGGFNPQQGGYPPQQGGYPPPQGGYPPQQGGYPPPQGGYPQQQGGYPPPQGGFPPQQGGYGQPPPGQFPGQQQGYGGAPPSFPSPGYDPKAMAQGDAGADADKLRKAMKGFGTDEKKLIEVLSKADPLRMALIRHTYTTRLGRNLEKDVVSETSSDFQEALVALIRGPLMQDVHNVRRSIKGAGTNENLLDDVLIARSNADMRAIKQAYRETFNKSLEEDVRSDLSLQTKEMYDVIMSARRAEESAPVIPDQINRDCTTLHAAMINKMGNYTKTVCEILPLRSDGQLRAIAQQFQQTYRETLVKVIEKAFSGHMENAFLLMVERASDKAMADAIQLEESMKGMGTNELLLIQRTVRVHWNRMHMEQVKRAYKHKYKKDLIERVKGEVGGDLEKVLVACLV